MTASRSVLGLLLCSIVLCGLAQGAAASAAKNTTAFTCIEVPTPKTGEFNDAHCDSKNSEGEGEFALGEIGLETTKIQLTNAETKNSTKEASNAVLKGTVFGAKFEMTCNTSSGEGSITNEEPEIKTHRFKGSVVEKLSSCTVNKPTVGCKVKEPIEISANLEGLEGIGSGKNEMGLEFKPAAETLALITLEKCIFSGTYKLGGTAIATGTPATTEKHSGATWIFTNAMTKETLKLAGQVAELESSTTVRVKGEGGKPVTLRTIGCEETEWLEEDCSILESPEKTEKELEEGWEPPEEEGVEESEKSAEEQEAAGHDPILFVHGYLGNAKTFATMIARFEKDGWTEERLRNLVYLWPQTNTATGSEVGVQVEDLLKDTHASKVDIITHSMGAISSRYFLKFLGGTAKVDDWVSLGSPNHGTKVARECSLWYESCKEMEPGSALLEELEEPTETPGAVHYATWWSPCDIVIIPGVSAQLGGTATNTMTPCLTHSGLHEDKGVYEEVREFVK